MLIQGAIKDPPLKGLKNPADQWEELWTQIKIKRVNLGLGVTIWVLTLIGFHMLSQAESFFSLTEPITLNTDTPEKLIESIFLLFLSPFIHLNLAIHLIPNLLILIITLIPFMAYYGVTKSSFLLITIGITTRLLGLILHLVSVGGIELLIILNKSNFVFPESLAQYKITIGVSGMVMALVGFFLVKMICESLKKKSLVYRKEKSIWICGLLFILILIVVFYIDANNYLAVYGEWFQALLFGEVLMDFTFSSGNHYFGHLFGFLLGSLLGWYEGSRLPNLTK